jgi:hypothetical protein
MCPFLGASSGSVTDDGPGANDGTGMYWACLFFGHIEMCIFYTEQMHSLQAYNLSRVDCFPYN